MMKQRVWGILAICLIGLAGCALGASPQRETSRLTSEDAAMEAPAEGFSTAGGDADTSLNYFSAQLDEAALRQAVQEPLIIRTGQLELVVEDVDEAVAEITQLAQDVGGWIVSTNVRQYTQYRRGNIQIRVPVADFAAAMQMAKDLALEVQSESTSGQDVTEEFVDVSARLANLEVTADRVRSFLQQADDVEEALAVNRELSRLESEIESLKGRQNYLQQSASFSTITVELIPDEASQPIEIGGWRPVGVAKDALETLVAALQGLANVALYVVILVLPLLLVVLVPLYFLGRLVLRWVRRRRRNGQAQPEESETSS